MIELPIERIEAISDNPHFIVIYGKPKSGKTTIAVALENNLIVDLEGGTKYMDAVSVQARTVSDIGEIITALKAKKKELGKNPYKYITIDSGTVLEDIARDYALILYQQTPMAKDKVTGKLYNDDILKLPKGAGYLYLREAFEKLYKSFFDLADHIILICHCKDNLVDKDGKELSEMSIDLSGKVGRIVQAKADAVGYVYREKNFTYINFNGGGNSICEARPKHLRGQTILIAESDEDNNVTVFTEKLYLPE